MFKIVIKDIAFLVLFCGCIYCLRGQQNYPILVCTSFKDEMVIISLNKPSYFPEDTVIISIQRDDISNSVKVKPILIIEGTTLTQISNDRFTAILLKTCKPGIYRVRLKVQDFSGRNDLYETDCIVFVEEHQEIEELKNYVSISPNLGSENIDFPVTLSRNLIRELRVLFNRSNIRSGMGPQFLRIKTSIELRDGTIYQSSERRILTFRSDSDPNWDRSMLVQYRVAYGTYAAIKPEEFSEVQILIDSLPDWALVKINIEPDYSIKIGAINPLNTYTRYFRIRGSSMEMGFDIGIPKVLFDSNKDDPIEYGNTSAIMRFYSVNETSGERFPVNCGIGTFGVNSPIDVGIGRGGFVLSVFFNVADLTKLIGLNLGNKFSMGLELSPFVPIKKKARFLITAQIGITL